MKTNGLAGMCMCVCVSSQIAKLVSTSSFQATIEGNIQYVSIPHSKPFLFWVVHQFRDLQLIHHCFSSYFSALRRRRCEIATEFGKHCEVNGCKDKNWNEGGVYNTTVIMLFIVSRPNRSALRMAEDLRILTLDVSVELVESGRIIGWAVMTR